ncbi:MAG: hypothetical protein IPP77_14050 [Bacteroidetes bacterium]|nr:hypothetical protein [Bacteroidota bacterium]
MLDKIFNPSPTIHKWDRFWVGFLPGMVAPLLGLVFFYFLNFREYTIEYYLQMASSPTVLSPMLSFGAVMNLFLFFPLIWKDYYNAARGVIGATIIYAIPIAIIKFV